MDEKKFLKPEAEIIDFADEDIITGSGEIGTLGVDSIPWYE